MTDKNVIDLKIDSLLDKAKKEINNIQNHIGCELISIVYNPYKRGIKKVADCGDFRDDSWYLKAVIENSNLTKASVMLHGQGGDFKVGIKMAYVLRNSFKKYYTYVPSLCCSALCFSALKSDQLNISDDAKITQIDPFFQDDEELFWRAIEFQFDQSEYKKLKSKKVLSGCKSIIMKLIKEKPSLYDHSKDDFEEHYDTEQIADKFMWKDDHTDPITYEEMRKLNLKVRNGLNQKLTDLMKQHIQTCQEILLWQDKRVLFGTSKTYSYSDGSQGNFLRLN